MGYQIKLTDEQIEHRLNLLESKIASERDIKNLPALNDLFQKLVEELAQREMDKSK